MTIRTYRNQRECGRCKKSSSKCRKTRRGLRHCRRISKADDQVTQVKAAEAQNASRGRDHGGAYSAKSLCGEEDALTAASPFHHGRVRMQMESRKREQQTKASYRMHRDAQPCSKPLGQRSTTQKWSCRCRYNAMEH